MNSICIVTEATFTGKGQNQIHSRFIWHLENLGRLFLKKPGKAAWKSFFLEKYYDFLTTQGFFFNFVFFKFKISSAM